MPSNPRTPPPGSSPKSDDGRLFRAAGREIRRHTKRQRDEEDAPAPALGLGRCWHNTAQHDGCRLSPGHYFATHHHGHAVWQLHATGAASHTIGGGHEHTDSAESAATTESVPGQLGRCHLSAVPPPPPSSHAGASLDAVRYLFGIFCPKISPSGGFLTKHVPFQMCPCPCKASSRR